MSPEWNSLKIAMNEIYEGKGKGRKEEEREREREVLSGFPEAHK